MASDLNPYLSQCQQDSFVDARLHCLRDGFFVDVGASDGEMFSNTAFFERERGWTGLCIEPHPEQFKKLSANRSAKCVQAAVSDYDIPANTFLAMTGDGAGLSRLDVEIPDRYTEVEDRYLRKGERFEKVEVPVRRLQTLFDEHGITHIDYLSLDVEGHEIKAMCGIDFSKVHIQMISIEDNRHNLGFPQTMLALGYRLVAILQQDEIYEKF